MRFINHTERMTIDAGEGRGIDVERASGGRLPASPAEAIDRRSELRAWAEGHRGDADVEIDRALIGPPSPAQTPQFSLGKSLPGFGPIGPALVTPDELDDRELTCAVNGEEVQRGRTADFIFSIGQRVDCLSATTVLYLGDLIMTGTPSGVGFSPTPPRYLQPSDVLESRIHQLGAMRYELVLDPVQGGE
jgi:hypothetical protein